MDSVRLSVQRDIGRADRIVLGAILVIGAVGGGALAILGLVTGIRRILDPARFPVTLLADVPVAGGQGIVEVHGDSIVVHADGLSSGAVWLLAGGDMTLGLTIGAVTATFGFALWCIVQRRPFHRTMWVAAVVAGCAISLGGMLTQGLTGFGQLMTLFDLKRTLGDIAEPGFLFTPLPILVGFGVIALAYVFQAGARLQRDTEGLV